MTANINITPVPFILHFHTQQCVQKAKALLAIDDIDSLRYASIQLRMGIEYLFYELLPMYKEELPDDITSKWQPNQILEALLQCDPTADHDGKLGFGPSEAIESTDPGSFVFIRDIKSPNKKLLKDHYHRLGFYLHAPVDFKQPDPVKWRSDLEKAVDTLTPFDETQILCNLGQRERIKCESCGRQIVKNRKAIEQSSEIRCLDPKCRAIHDAKIEDGTLHWQLREATFVCPYCDLENSFSFGQLKDGLILNCNDCKKRIEFKSSFELVPRDGIPKQTQLDISKTDDSSQLEIEVVRSDIKSN